MLIWCVVVNYSKYLERSAKKYVLGTISWIWFSDLSDLEGRWIEMRSERYSMREQPYEWIHRLVWVPCNQFYILQATNEGEASIGLICSLILEI